MSKDDLMNIDNVEIEALDDQELEAVAGGLKDSDPEITTHTSCMCCVSGTTFSQE